MNLRATSLAFYLLLIAGHSVAREPQAPPSPIPSAGKGATAGAIFVGHYGEAIEIPHGWTAEVEMRRETEAIYFHRKSHDDSGFKPFQPKQSDYVSENFAPLGLIELVVIPKDAPGGLRTLKAIRKAKEHELKLQAADFQVFDETGQGDWPRNTFHVKTEKPHRLWQTYAETPTEFYILTYGGRLETGDFGLDEHRIQDFSFAKQTLNRSLSAHLLLANQRSPAGRLFSFRTGASDGLLSDYLEMMGTPPLLPTALGAFGALLLILSSWPSTFVGAERVRRFGRSMLVFSLFTGLGGFLIISIPAYSGDALWNSDEFAALIPVLLVPVASWAAARKLGSARPIRVLASTGLLAVAWALVLMWGADFNNADSAAVSAVGNTLLLLFVGLTFGIAYAVSFGSDQNKRVPR